MNVPALVARIDFQVQVFDVLRALEWVDIRTREIIGSRKRPTVLTHTRGDYGHTCSVVRTAEIQRPLTIGT